MSEAFDSDPVNDEQETGAAGTSNNHRFRWIALIVVASLLVTGGAFAAGMWVRSGNEEAVANAKLKPDVSAKVQERSFAQPVVETTGKVSVGTAWDLNIASAEDALSVVTETRVVAGDTLSSGQWIGSISGQPVFALTLPFVLYRDIRGGDSGDDVRAIQTALKNLGYYKSGVDGKYGQSTITAIAALYKKSGLEPPQASEQAKTDLVAAQNAVNDAKEDPGALASARADLEVKKKAAMPPVSRGSIAPLPDVNATVVSISGVGTLVSNETPFAKLRSGETTVKARIDVAAKESFAVGASVRVQLATDTGVEVAGSVASVGEFTNGGETEEVPGYDITIALESSDGFSDGANVKVVAQGGGEETLGLAVPVTALREEGGSTYVLSDEKKIAVTVKMTGDGYALVEGKGLEKGVIVAVTGRK